MIEAASLAILTVMLIAVILLESIGREQGLVRTLRIAALPMLLLVGILIALRLNEFR